MSRKTLEQLKAEMDDAADVYKRHPSPYLAERARKAKQSYNRLLNNTFKKVKNTAVQLNLMA